MLLRLLIFVSLGVCATGVQLGAQTLTKTTEVIRVNDSLLIRVVGQPSVSGTYQVDADGSVSIPLVGVVPAANQTVTAFGDFVKARLDAFVRNPDVRVDLDRASRIFLLGEIRVPGEYPLTPGLTVVEALAQAGYTGSGEVLIVRTPGAIGPVLPDVAAPSNVIRVNLRDLEKAAERGDLSGNRRIEANDTIFVPKIDPTLVYIEGRVRKPGPYSVPDGTTVLQAVTLAGGPTDDAALNRVRVTRLTEGASSRSARLTDVVRPGDSIAVPEAFQIPSVFSTGLDGSPRRTPFRILLGSNVALTPSFEITRVGADTSVFSGSENLQAIPLAMFGPSLGVTARTTRATVDLYGRYGIAVFPGHSSENSAQPGYGISASVRALPRVTLRGQWNVNYTRDHWNSEVDLLARRRDETQSVGITLDLFRSISFAVDASDWRDTFDQNQLLYGVDLRQTLSERIRSLKGTLQFPVSPLSTIKLSVSGATHRFPFFPARDADSAEFVVGAVFKPGASINGEVQVSWLQYVPFSPLADSYEGPAGRLSLSRSFWQRTSVGVLGERLNGSSFAPQFAFSVVDRAGGWVQQVLTRRLDLVVQGFREHYNNRPFASVAPNQPLIWADSDSRRYQAQLGVRVGRARVAANLGANERLYPRAFQSLAVWVDVSYGIFQVTNR